MGPINILTEPNQLRGGNIYVIPFIILNPKDEKGDFPTEIQNYKKNSLKQLVNATHSKDGDFKYWITLVDDKLVSILIFLSYIFPD